jgi:RimJ/RimL family protein N-acetyltransferase
MHRKETDELIGDCGFFDMDNINQPAEAGILIGNKNIGARDMVQKP